MKRKVKKRSEKWPSVSFVVCTYNCKDYAKRCFTSMLNQDYPQKKIEILALDGGSTDGTIELAKKMGVKVINNPAKLPEGRGRGKWLGFRKAKGEIVIFVDSDNKLVEKDWLKQMVSPLINDPNVNFAICRMSVVKSDKLINRYLSLMGTDPIAGYKSIDSLLALRKLKLVDKGDYYTYTITPKNFIITGGFYFAVKKKTLQKIGGYTQDTDVVYNLAKSGMGTVAIPKKAHVHHLIIKSVNQFLKKKIWWAKVYFRKQRKGRDFDWIPSSPWEKIKLGTVMMSNLLVVPQLIVGIEMAIKDRESSWLLHPFIGWLTAFAYCYAYITSKLNPSL